MKYKTIKVNLRDNIGCLVLNRPDVMNALNSDMRFEIKEAILGLEKSVRVIVITGRGRAFCSGQDLTDRRNSNNVDLEKTLNDEYVPMLRAIIDCSIPTVTALNGAAAGAGANLALCSDIVIACKSAYLMQAFTRIGLIPDAGGTYIMPRAMGMAKAMGAALFGEKIYAEQAEKWGLIWEVAEDENFEKIWRARAEYLAKGPTLAYTNVKKALKVSMDNTLSQQLVLEAQLQKDCGKTDDFSEGVKAFIEKRTPSFTGN